MPKYLFQVNYTLQGVQGLLKEGGTSRRNLLENLVKNLGENLESFYGVLGFFLGQRRRPAATM